MFDSGVGGLTVVRALMERLPFESNIYFWDTARVPYGVKSVETVTQYAVEITDFLLKKGVKLLVIACNTVAAVAGEAVRSRSPVPVLDVIDAGRRAARPGGPRRKRRRHRNPATSQTATLTPGHHRPDSGDQSFPRLSALCSPRGGRLARPPGDAG